MTKHRIYRNFNTLQHCLQCFDAVGWAAGRVSSLQENGGWWRWALVSPDGVAPSWMVSVSAYVNLPLHHKVQKFSSGTGSHRWSRKRAVKRLRVCVCVRVRVCVCVCNILQQVSTITITPEVAATHQTAADVRAPITLMQIKVKSIIPHEECWWGAHLPYFGPEPIGG